MDDPFHVALHQLDLGQIQRLFLRLLSFRWLKEAPLVEFLIQQLLLWLCQGLRLFQTGEGLSGMELLQQVAGLGSP